MRRPHARWISPLLLVLLAHAAPVVPASGNLTITATFRFQGDDAAARPVAGAYCELRDSDPVSDDVLAFSMTDSTGTVSFTYDSGLDDGWFGGRVDPYVRCYSRLFAGSGDRAVEKIAIVKPWRLAPTSLFTEPSRYEISTPTWNNNNENRTASVTDDTDGRHAFAIMAMIARANVAQPRPGGTLADSAPMALQGDTCAGRTLLVYPAQATTGFQSTVNEILIEDEYRSDADTVVHEYGHHEMWDAYGASVFGDYSRTRRDHSFTDVVGDESLSWNAASSGFANPFWTAFAEAWADFAAVVTKGYPRYRDQDVEADDPMHSPRCEGTICRIFWDIWDTSADQVVDGDRNPIPRQRLAGVVMDDDPFGFIPGPPFSAFPGRDQLKSLLRNDKPTSLAAFRAAFVTRYGADALTRRAFDSILYRHGIRDGITEHAPHLQLAVTGSEQGGVYSGALQMSASVTDADITAATPEDGRLMHVVFYWTHYSDRSDMLADVEPARWHPICVDTNGSDGWRCTWPATAADRPAPDYSVVITAVASDFFEHSAFGFKTATFTAAQHGPFRLAADATGGGTTGGGGIGELSAEESGPLASEGHISTQVSVANMRYDDGHLLLANGYSGLKIYEASGSATAPLSIYKPAGAVFRDTCFDVDAFTRRDSAGGLRRYAALAFGTLGLRILDITDPAGPVEVGYLKAVPDRALSGPTTLNARLVTVQGTYAYVGSGRGVSIVDISDPREPREVAYWAPAKAGSCGDIRQLRVQGAIAYLACSGTGLTMLDLAQVRAQRVYLPQLARKNPTMIVPEAMILGNYAPAGFVQALDLIRRPEEDRTWAVILEVARRRGDAQGAHVIDVTNPREPVRQAVVPLPGTPNRVRSAGNRAYIGHSNGLTILDISAPGMPSIAGEIRRLPFQPIQVIEVAGQQVFVSTGESVHVLIAR